MRSWLHWKSERAWGPAAPQRGCAWIFAWGWPGSPFRIWEAAEPQQAAGDRNVMGASVEQPQTLALRNPGEVKQLVRPMWAEVVFMQLKTKWWHSHWTPEPEWLKPGGCWWVRATVFFSRAWPEVPSMLRPYKGRKWAGKWALFLNT